MRVIRCGSELGLSAWIKQDQPDFRTGPKIQTVWGFSEALIFLLEGIGVTVLSFSMLLKWPLMTLVGLAAITIAILLLLKHLGHPTRAIKVLTGLKGSWISRGTLFLGSCFVVGCLWLLVNFWAGAAWTSVRTILTVLACCLSAIILMYPGFVLAYSDSIPFWHSGMLPLFFALNGISTGLSLILLYGLMKSIAIVFILRKLTWLQVIVLSTLLIIAFAYLEVMRKTGRGARLSVEVLVKQERLIFAVFGCLIGTVVPLVLILLAVTHVLVGSTLILMLISAICRSSGDLALRYSFLRVGIYDPIY